MLSSLGDVVKALAHPFQWLSNRANRVRIRGGRVEIMAFILCRNPEPAILLGQSAYGMWMPPQEGVNLHETFEQALRRSLEVECGLDLPNTDRELSRQLHLRSIRYVGVVPLAEERHGERPVADDALGTWLEHVQLKRKAYWMATMLLANQSDITPHADGKELIDLRWFPLAAARQAIAETNHPEKSELLLKSLDACEKDLTGVKRET
jgi:ADP-ribose pyrophosphatase YjhB (NUDIX family)